MVITWKSPFFRALFRSRYIHSSIFHRDFWASSFLKFQKSDQCIIQLIQINNSQSWSQNRTKITSTAVALANWNKSAYVTPEYLSLIGWRSFNAFTSPDMSIHQGILLHKQNSEKNMYWKMAIIKNNLTEFKLA